MQKYSSRRETNLLLKQMNFPLSFTWSYDPFGVISKLRVEQKTTPYVHTQRPKIEKYKLAHLGGKYVAGGRGAGIFKDNFRYSNTQRENI